MTSEDVTHRMVDKFTSYTVKKKPRSQNNEFSINLKIQAASSFETSITNSQSTSFPRRIFMKSDVRTSDDT
jgi:hypothetical protein